MSISAVSNGRMSCFIMVEPYCLHEYMDTLLGFLAVEVSATIYLGMQMFPSYFYLL